VLICLPAGYAQNPDRRYPSVYIYDGKDALVRGRYDGTLQRLSAANQIPSVIGVFVSSPPTPAARLATYASFPDPTYPEINPLGDSTAKTLLNQVLPAVDKAYRTATPRALLGIDIAGPYSFLVAWQDVQHRFTRIASQSGRFGWGDDKLLNSPYIRALATDKSATIDRLSFDYSDSDSAQAQAMVHDAVRAALSQAGYAGKVQITRQGTATTQLWDGLRSRLDGSLIFLLRDLVKLP
jgi:enterochelin esterase-like enzyme